MCRYRVLLLFYPAQGFSLCIKVVKSWNNNKNCVFVQLLLYFFQKRALAAAAAAGGAMAVAIIRLRI